MSLRVCVFCSSSDAIESVYLEEAARLGAAIARQGFTLVFGGCDVGAMGAAARAAHEGGGRVVGVVPESLLHLAYAKADRLLTTSDLRQRQARMEEEADAFVVLPGGFGTLEELFETVNHRYLGYHDKPLGVVNQDGFFAPLLEFFEKLYRDRFASEKFRRLLLIDASAERVLAAVADAAMTSQQEKGV